MSANRLESRMQTLLEKDSRGVAPYLTAGDGGLDTTLAVLEALDAGGPSCIELPTAVLYPERSPMTMNCTPSPMCWVAMAEGCLNPRRDSKKPERTGLV